VGERPLVPDLNNRTITHGEYLGRQVELLREAQRDGEPVAAELLRGTACGRGTVEELLNAELTLETARLAVARDHGYASWTAAGKHSSDLVDGRFEAAADAIQWGDITTLQRLLDEDPELVRARSPFVHRTTLLHHVAANGIEVERQLQSPPNAAEIMRLLLERGSEPDAVCDTYGGERFQTTLYLLVSSIVPATAGVQAQLVEELCRAGAASNGPGDDGEPLWTAITFGYTDAVEALVRCGARVDNVVFAAALGDLAGVRRFFDEAGRLKPGRARSTRRSGSRRPPLRVDGMLEYALIWAALHGRREVCTFLLEKQPDLSFAEPFFGSTAIGAARYHGYHEIVAMLESARVEQNHRR